MTYLHCNCLRTNPPGHHWEGCPAFDPEQMETSEQVRERGADPSSLSPSEYVKRVTCAAYPIDED